jgi:hypothetical protein
MAPRTLLERIVDERVGLGVVGSGSVAVHRLAKEIAREALPETVRRRMRELVRVRSQELLDRLLRDGKPVRQSPARRKPARA